jgi:hypothetical protein
MLRSSERKLHLGQAISADVVNLEFPDHFGSVRERILTPASREFGIANLVPSFAAPAAFTWPGANDVVAIPFQIFTGMTVYQLGWYNGSGTMTDGCDIGIYDAAWARKVSGGGTTRTGVSLIQWVDVADTYLPPGKYFVAMSNNGVTNNNARSTNGVLSISFLQTLGCFDSATASYPLPDPLAGMAAASIFSSIPICFIAGRVPF